MLDSKRFLLDLSQPEQLQKLIKHIFSNVLNKKKFYLPDMRELESVLTDVGVLALLIFSNGSEYEVPNDVWLLAFF